MVVQASFVIPAHPTTQTLAEFLQQEAGVTSERAAVRSLRQVSRCANGGALAICRLGSTAKMDGSLFRTGTRMPKGVVRHGRAASEKTTQPVTVSAIFW